MRVLRGRLRLQSDGWQHTSGLSLLLPRTPEPNSMQSVARCSQANTRPSTSCKLGVPRACLRTAVTHTTALPLRRVLHSCRVSQASNSRRRQFHTSWLVSSLTRLGDDASLQARQRVGAWWFRCVLVCACGRHAAHGSCVVVTLHLSENAISPLPTGTSISYCPSNRPPRLVWCVSVGWCFMCRGCHLGDVQG